VYDFSHASTRAEKKKKRTDFRLISTPSNHFPQGRKEGNGGGGGEKKEKKKRNPAQSRINYADFLFASAGRKREKKGSRERREVELNYDKNIKVETKKGKGRGSSLLSSPFPLSNLPTPKRR